MISAVKSLRNVLFPTPLGPTIATVVKDKYFYYSLAIHYITTVLEIHF